MVELPKTEAELQAYVDSQVQAARETITKEFDNKFAAQRTKHDQEIKKLKEDAGKTAEELAQERIKEQQERDAKELEDLRAYKRSSIIGEKLAKEGLPNFLKNDTRLLSAEEGDYDKVIKSIKKEWEDSLPKGNQHSTIVQTSGQQQQGAGDGDKAKAEFGKALKDLVS